MKRPPAPFPMLSVMQHIVPKDAEEQLLALLAQFKEARAAWDAERAAAAAAGGQEEQHEGLELEEGEEEQVCVSLHGGGPQ